jgi:hypothetical protein
MVDSKYLMVYWNKINNSERKSSPELESKDKHIERLCLYTKNQTVFFICIDFATIFLISQPAPNVVAKFLQCVCVYVYIYIYIYILFIFSVTGVWIALSF